MRQSPDDREPVEDTTPVAKRGTVRPDQNIKNALTWIEEAKRNIRTAANYYRRAADWYDRAGMPVLASECRKYANKLETVVYDV